MTLSFLIPLVGAAQSSGSSGPVFYGYRVVKSYPHDTKCYTEGLQWTGKGFFESCGENGKSNLRETALDGTVLRQKELPGDVFAEGVSVLGGKLYQLTWKNNYAFVHDAASFKSLGTLKYPAALREGWGMTTDGRSLIVSDGSDQIRWLNPKTLAVEKSLAVRNNERPVTNLNELELIGGELWANVWMTDLVARIDLKSGRITGWVNFAGLRPQSTLNNFDSVLNGIAYDAQKKRLFVTGKNWDRLFEITVVKP